MKYVHATTGYHHETTIKEDGVEHIIFIPASSTLNVIKLTSIVEIMLNGEPVFILRAQDNASTVGILAYQNKVRDLITRVIARDPFAANTTDKLNNVLQRTTAALQKFFNWQRQNPTHVKQAD